MNQGEQTQVSNVPTRVLFVINSFRVLNSTLWLRKDAYYAQGGSTSELVKEICIMEGRKQATANMLKTLANTKFQCDVFHLYIEFNIKPTGTWWPRRPTSWVWPLWKRIRDKREAIDKQFQPSPPSPSSFSIEANRVTKCLVYFYLRRPDQTLQTVKNLRGLNKTTPYTST